MAQESSHQNAAEPLLAAWIKWTMEFWESLAQMGPGLTAAGRSGASSEGGAPIDPWLSSLKLWQAFFSLLTEPETVAAVFQGIQAPSEITLRMAQAGWGGYFQLHRRWLAGWQGNETAVAGRDYDHLDQDLYKICHEVHERDFRQFLDLPHLRSAGLPPQRFTQAMETFNQFQAAMAEFIYLIYLPLKKSLRAMEQAWGHGGQDPPPEDFKEYYKKWLKILEGHYMTLFQSAEYTRTLSHTLNALEDFTLVKQDLQADALAALSLPSHRDLEALYREIYLLKKTMKALAKDHHRREPSREEG